VGDRPKEFRINWGHPLANGLRFADLGRFARTGIAFDSSLYGSHGTLTNMVPSTDWVWLPQLGRWARNFDGSNDYIALPAERLAPLQTGTVAAWINCTGYASSREIFTVGNTSTVNTYFSVMYGNQTTGKLALFHRVTSNGVMGGTVLSTGQWWHVAATSTGSAWNLFVNGLAETLTVTGSNSGDWFGDVTAANTVSIGTLRNSASPNGTLWWYGRMADLMVWDRVLDPAELADLARRDNVMLSGLIVSPRRRLARVGQMGVWITAALSGVASSTGRTGKVVAESATASGGATIQGFLGRVTKTASGVLAGSGLAGSVCRVAGASAGVAAGGSVVARLGARRGASATFAAGASSGFSGDLTGIIELAAALAAGGSMAARLGARRGASATFAAGASSGFSGDLTGIIELAAALAGGASFHGSVAGLGILGAKFSASAVLGCDFGSAIPLVTAVGFIWNILGQTDLWAITDPLNVWEVSQSQNAWTVSN
jgi:hypothetical protein